VIYVDNASTDGTLEWLAATWPSVRVVALSRNRFGIAREHGLRLVRGRHTMFLDSDAQLTPGALETMVDALDAHPDWGMVGPRLVYDDGKTVRHHLMADDDHGHARPVLYVISACQLFRTDLARKAGPFDEHALAWGWEDTDWCLRIRDAGGEIVYLPSATVIHTYRRLTAAKPVSTDALKQLRAHARFPLKYLRRRRELIALSERLDLEAR
jgi:GT2 family glycosyltransferase